jgi:hypothetical protein
VFLNNEFCHSPTAVTATAPPAAVGITTVTSATLRGAAGVAIRVLYPLEQSREELSFDFVRRSEQVLRAGGVLVVPRGTRHGFIVTSQTARILLPFTASPGGRRPPALSCWFPTDRPGAQPTPDKPETDRSPGRLSGACARAGTPSGTG